MSVLLVAGPVALLGSSGYAQEKYADPLDNSRVFSASFFESNGTFQERYGVWWLSSANPFRFRRHYTATWYFDNLPLAELTGESFILKLAFDVFSHAIEGGGEPSAATVRITAQNPETEEIYAISRIRVEMNKEGEIIPTYLYIPRKLVSTDGRTVVTVFGLGQIGVSQEKMLLLFPLQAIE